MSTAPALSEGNHSCKCNAGYTNWLYTAIHSCAACAKGKYKAKLGPMGCDDCAAGKYLDSTGNVHSDNCTSCIDNSTSKLGSGSMTACMCNPGYTGDNGGDVCTACESGKYKGTTGSVTCVDCDAGKYLDTQILAHTRKHTHVCVTGLHVFGQSSPYLWIEAHDVYIHTLCR